MERSVLVHDFIAILAVARLTSCGAQEYGHGEFFIAEWVIF